MTIRSRGRLAGTIALLATVALGTTACVDSSEGTPSGSGSETADPAAVADRGAPLRVSLPYGYNSFDPHKSPSAQGDQVFLRPVYDSLLTIDRSADGVTLTPQLATSYKVSADGRSVTFALRKGVKFQDGAPFDAEAVKANLTRATGPGSTVASLLSSIAGVDVVDASDVVLRLKQPDPSVLWAMAFGTTGMMISPKAMDNSDLAAKPVGAGPYKLVSAAKDATIVYQRWDGYWDKDAALASKITVSTVSDPNVAFNGTRSGEFDISWMTPPFDSRSKQLTAQGYRWEQALSPVAYGVLLHTGKAPFNDVRVRRAVSMALDRKTISTKLLNGVSPPSYQAFGKGYLGYDKTLDKDPYNVAAAKALVSAAGATGTVIKLIQPTQEPQKSLAEILQQDLAAIGLKAELVPLSPTEGRPAWRTGAYQAMVAPIIAQPEPSFTLDNSYLGGDNLAPPPAELSALALKARALPVGSAAREAAYKQISAYLVANPIHIPIAQFSTVLVGRPDVVGSRTLMATGIADLDFRGVGRSGK